MAHGATNTSRGGFVAITTARKLLTDSWTKDVETMEAVVGRFRADHAARNDCHVVFFEMDRDVHLHVNVTHKCSTKSVPGWAGPASLPQGFVHNRTGGPEISTFALIEAAR
jgi:hypothetical protein